MKNILIYGILILLAVSCRQQDDDLLKAKPEQRLATALTEYQQQLTGSEFGWNAYLFPGVGGGYSFLMEFSTEGRVTMMSDINTTTAGKAFESSYRLEAVQRPSLFFDTYSYIHLLSDPNPDSLNSIKGSGFMSDFEFGFESSSQDTIKLKGNQNGSLLLLIRASADKSAVYKAGHLNVLMPKLSSYVTTNPYNYLEFEDEIKVKLSMDIAAKVISLSYLDGNKVDTMRSAFAYTADGMFFKKPLRYRDKEFSEIFYDESASRFYVTVKGIKHNVTSSDVPVIPLYKLLGIDFTVISTPPRVMRGSSDDYNNAIQTFADNLYYGDYQLQLSYIELVFDTEKASMDYNIYFVQNNEIFRAQYPYSYSVSSNGVFKFTPAGSPDGNAQLVAKYSQPITDHITNDRFIMQYVNTDKGLTGQMKDLDAPFDFAGYFYSVFK